MKTTWLLFLRTDEGAARSLPQGWKWEQCQWQLKPRNEKVSADGGQWNETDNK